MPARRPRPPPLATPPRRASIQHLSAIKKKTTGNKTKTTKRPKITTGITWGGGRLQFDGGGTQNGGGNGGDPDVTRVTRCPHRVEPRRPHGCHQGVPNVTQRPIWDGTQMSPMSPDVPNVTHTSPVPSGCPKWILVTPMSPRCAMGWDPDVPHVIQRPIWDGIKVSPRCPQCHPDAHMGWH